MNPMNINLDHSNVDVVMNDKELEELKEQYIQIINNMDLLVEQLKNYEDDRNKILKILYSKYNIEDGLLDMDFEETDMNDALPDMLQPTNDFSSGNKNDLESLSKETESETNIKKPKAKKSTKATKTEKTEVESVEQETTKKPATKTKKAAVKKEETNDDNEELKTAAKKTTAKTKKSPKPKKTNEISENKTLETAEEIIQEAAKLVKTKTTKKKSPKSMVAEVVADDVIINDQASVKPIKKTKKTTVSK